MGRKGFKNNLVNRPKHRVCHRSMNLFYDRGCIETVLIKCSSVSIYLYN